MTAATAAAAILVLCDRAVLATNVLAFSLEITLMTARTVGRPSDGGSGGIVEIIAIPDRGRDIRGMACITRDSRAVVTRILTTRRRGRTRDGLFPGCSIGEARTVVEGVLI